LKAGKLGAVQSIDSGVQDSSRHAHKVIF
jgi:hypothetical protein